MKSWMREIDMKIKNAFLTTFYILWAVLLTFAVNFANTPVRTALADSFPAVHLYIYDIFSDAVWLSVALFVAVLMPRFFGYQIGDTFKHKKVLIGMLLFFAGTPLVYRLLMGGIPFSANTWFFEGIVVPFTEEGFFRGIIFTVMLWGLGKIYSERTAQILALIISTFIYAFFHLGNIGTYPTGFILFQVSYSIIFGLLFGYSRLTTRSIYPAILFHAIVNLVGTVG
jgi:membrane protease YdiL (CAAX protease family)